MKMRSFTVLALLLGICYWARRPRPYFGICHLTFVIALYVLIPLAFVSGADKRYITVRFPSGAKITAEMADTEEKRTLGLMFREHLDPDQGMIFIFPVADYYRFWMKNCLFDIDIIWLDEKKRIVYHEENLPPCKADPCPSYGHQGKALYVVETTGGFFKKMGLKNGMIVEFSLTKS